MKREHSISIPCIHPLVTGGHNMYGYFVKIHNATTDKLIELWFKTSKNYRIIVIEEDEINEEYLYTTDEVIDTTVTLAKTLNMTTVKGEKNIYAMAEEVLIACYDLGLEKTIRRKGFRSNRVQFTLLSLQCALNEYEKRDNKTPIRVINLINGVLDIWEKEANRRGQFPLPPKEVDIGKYITIN